MSDNAGMKKKPQAGKIIRYVLFIILLLLPIVVARLVDFFCFPAQISRAEITVVKIPKGADIESIADTLLKKQLIGDKKTFLFWAKTLNRDRSLKAGYFEIPADLNYPQLVAFLSAARNKELRVTLREGWCIPQIATELQQQLDIDADRFKALCYDQQILSQLGINAQSLEGYLLPDTYYFYWNMAEKEIIELLVKACMQTFTDSVQLQLKQVNFTPHQILTLASIIEGEAIFDDERAIISSVYHNRLKHRIKLQADPTIQYILHDSPRRLLLKDLEIDTPYNTYKYYGLPPGPINNPGRKSIIAAAYPRQTDYLYFVARGDGRHTFTRSAAEHAQEKAKFDKIRREINRRNRLLKLSQ
jgi:UPF0755 protein